MKTLCKVALCGAAGFGVLVGLVFIGGAVAVWRVARAATRPFDDRRARDAEGVPW